MYEGTQFITIQNNFKDVYKTVETYPHFVRFFSKKSRIIKQSHDHMEVEVQTRLLGVLPTRWKGEGVKRPYDSIEFTQTQGLFKGLTALWKFENAGDDKTVVSIKTSFSKPKLGKTLERFLGRFVVEKTTSRILKELMTHTKELHDLK